MRDYARWAPRYSALERHGCLLPGETPAAALKRADDLERIAAELAAVAANGGPGAYSAELLTRVAQEIRREALSMTSSRSAADYLPCDTEASDG